MDRKCMCIAVCVLIAAGSALFIVAAGIQTKLAPNPDDKKPPSAKERATLARTVAWCTQLSQLFGVVALLLILCCLCCQGVAFKGKDSYD